jgi:hypothetical protein
VRANRRPAVGSGPLDCVTRDITRRLAVATASLLALVATSGFRVLDAPISGRDPHSATVLSRLHAGHPQGHGATVSLEWRARAPGLREPAISTFTLTLAPGGSAILHRTPSPGYVLVHVLSGAIEARAWHARLGTYRASATWAEPAFAHDITAVNASASEPARAFVLVVANGGD